MAQLALRCLECRYTWKPRKDVTRYRRQCPKCDSYRLEELEQGREGEVKDTAQPVRTMVQESSRDIRWPKIAYDLMGISGASSPENGIAKALELYKRTLSYKFKYNVQSLEEVFRLLENKAAESNERFRSILRDPTLIFLETMGVDLAPCNYYEALQKKGYKGTFLVFLSEVVTAYFKDHEYNSPEDLAASSD